MRTWILKTPNMIRVLDCNFCAKSEHLFLGLSSLNYCQVIEGLLMQLNKNAHYRMA
jgi:hypothetical protein